MLETLETDCRGTLSVVLEQVFMRDASGRYGSLSTFDDTFWSRYLEAFDHVRIVARVQRMDVLPQGTSILSDCRVSVFEIPYYRGPLQYLKKVWKVRRALAQASLMGGDWVLRLPGVLGMDIGRRLISAGRSFGVELVGDPQEIFQPGAAGYALTRPLLRRWFVSRTRTMCSRATAVAYVSRHVLPQRYPAKAGAPVEHYSSINLPSHQFAGHPRTYIAPPNPIRILTVGSLAYSVKGVDVLLHTCSELRRRGLDVQLEIVGDGILRTQLESLAETLGISDIAYFSGHQPHDEIFARLDDSDLFVLPSRTEGLPRVVVEAMARAVPCLSTAVGGIPELLEPEWLVLPGDPNALADAIARAVASTETLTAMSSRNLRHARNYEAGALAVRRGRFYRAVRTIAEAS